VYGEGKERASLELPILLRPANTAIASSPDGLPARFEQECETPPAGGRNRAGVGCVLTRERSNIMSEGREFDRSLLTEVRRRLQRLSETQHRLARDHRILSDAATRLRLGKSAEAVLAEIREQSPELLQDYCDLQITPAPAPFRSIGRIAASA
jgi:hypothetical protein